LSLLFVDFPAHRPGELHVVAKQDFRKDQLIGVMARKLQELVGAARPPPMFHGHTLVLCL
jgi:hypothetical protein